MAWVPGAKSSCPGLRVAHRHLWPGEPSGGFGDSRDEELDVLMSCIEIQQIESQPSFPAEANRCEPGVSRGCDLGCSLSTLA